MKISDKTTKQRWDDDYKFRVDFQNEELSNFEKRISSFRIFYSENILRLKLVSDVGWAWSQQVYSFRSKIEFHARSMMGWPADNEELNPSSAKEVARIFGSDGWLREPDRQSCGSIDWKKDFCECELLIKNAEQVSPKLLREVRI